MADLDKRRREFESYASSKANEIDEQRSAWCYYHAQQFTKKQLDILEKRGQPAVTFDRVSRKIDGLVGIVRRLRTDPKAYPRTSHQDYGADIATQVIRTLCDQSRFEDIETECARDAAVAGLGVSELTFTIGDQGDPDFAARHIDQRTFFYDPRSTRSDFSDARFMGTCKWVGLDEIEEIAPGASKKVRGAGDGNFTTAFDADTEINWTDDRERVRLVDHWYIEGGRWKWCLHNGSVIIDEGESPFFNQFGASACKFFPFSNLVDQDGTRYGYIRRLKGPQDAMNQHRSKALHIMNTRQIKVRRGSVENIATLRREAAKPDGVLEYDGNPADFEIIQPAQEFLQQTQYYDDAKAEIEAFGPNPAMLGDLPSASSGRAYAMAQQAGLAELGPFLKNFRSWKLSQYQAMWCAAQRYWAAERFIRVTDDQDLASFLQVNGTAFDAYGQPALVNALGSIDVDIVISEGPDTETIMGDVYDTLTALAGNNVPVPPAALIEVSNLPSEKKKKLIGMMNAPDPAQEIAARLELEGKAAANAETQSRVALNAAMARGGTPSPASAQGYAPNGYASQDFEIPAQLQVEQALADIAETQASARQKDAQAMKTRREVAPA